MAIYNISGAELFEANDIAGSDLEYAYNLGGDIVFRKAPPVLKVMTYNPQWFTNLNSQQEMQDIIIDGNNADIIGFQEISKTGTIPTVGTNALTNYPYKRLSNHKNYTGMVAKIAFSNVAIADFENQDPLDASQYNETRAYMMSDISVGGKVIRWINTHLCYLTQSVKWLQMAEIFDLAEQYEYCIITGDFNSYCDSVEHTDYINMYKPFVDAGYHLANCTAERGFTKTWGDSRTATSPSGLTYPTDNIITSGNIDIVSVKFDTTKFDYLNGQAIDHIPIIVELLIN